MYDQSLYDLSKQFFSKKFDYEEITDGPVKGRSGQKWRFDAFITHNERKYGVFIREWNRSIGVNQIRILEKACRDTKCDGGILVGTQFSSNAEVYGENLGVQVVDKSLLISKIRAQI